MRPSDSCQHRISVIKRWIEEGVLFVIERCRRCGTWARREIVIKEQNGKFVDEMTVRKLVPKTYLSVERSNKTRLK